MNVKIIAVIEVGNEKLAVDNSKMDAKRIQQQATAAQARLKVREAQQQLTKVRQFHESLSD